MESFLANLPFRPDDFQLQAMEVIREGHSVVVCSPTGSGKTLIAEYAAHRAIEEGRKIFYTTPLKALSNQKLFDFRKIYGEERVGLLTGDISVNRNASIVVMTTEVYRNMLYGIHEDSRLVSEIGYVILDECHFMNDAERGTVWEETIIYCPESIQMIALSATIANALELTDWINEVHHNTVLVSSDFRPVPLRHFYFARGQLFPLFQSGGRQLNSKLKFDHRQRKGPRRKPMLDINELIQVLNARDMLPAIFFTFSRKGCDRNLGETMELDLLTDTERVRLAKEIRDYVRQHPFLEGNRYLNYLSNGFASHHAGLLPALKGLVEHLFQQGLIKAVFATETLAAGINMPARTTVITAISKRTNDGHRILTPSEFLQMSGRAGRRGMDEVGYVVTLSTPYESAQDVGLLASSPSDPLNSQFTPTYGMVLNLLQRYSLKDAEFLISKSFGNFTAERRIKPLAEEVHRIEAALAEIDSFTCPYDLTDKDLQSYLRSKDMLAESQRLVKMYQGQVKRHGPSPDMIRVLSQESGKRDSLRNSVEGVACYKCEVYKKHAKKFDRSYRLRKKLKDLRFRYDQERNPYWRSFTNHYNLLKEVGFLGEDDQPTEPGKLTANVRAENEFFVAQVILTGMLDRLDAGSLAAVVCAMINDSTRDNQYTRLRLSQLAQTTFEEMKRLAKDVQRIQRKHRIETDVILNATMSPLLQAWVEDYEWDRLMSTANVDEGDLVRVIRRTADMLRQLSRNPHVSPALNNMAAYAISKIYRDPIREETEGLLPEEGLPEDLPDAVSEISTPE